MALVYQHRRCDTGEVFYVGVGRDKYRASSTASRNIHWHIIVKKTSYLVEIVQQGLTQQTAWEREINLIALYGRSDLGMGPLVNMTSGGEGTGTYWKDKKQSTDHISKRVLKNKGLKRSQKAIENIRRGQLGKHHKTSTKEKISKSHVGKVLSEAHKESIRKASIRKLQVKCLEDGKIYESLRDASKAYNLDAATLTNHLKGRQKSIKQLHFQLVDSK